jgi:hypothetical protein
MLSRKLQSILLIGATMVVQATELKLDISNIDVKKVEIYMYIFMLGKMAILKYIKKRY